MIASRKASNLLRRQHDRNEAGESALVPAGEDGGLAELLEARPGGPFFDSVCGSCEELLSGLDDKLREVALLKLAGHTNEEIASLRQRSVKTVERYLQMIRVKWSA